jgi:hypothetical protein
VAKPAVPDPDQDLHRLAGADHPERDRPLQRDFNLTEPAARMPRAAGLIFWTVFLGKTLAIIWRICYNDATTQINTKPIRERIAKNAFPNPFSGFVSQQQKIAFFKRSFGCTMIIFGKEVDL